MASSETIGHEPSAISHDDKLVTATILIVDDEPGVRTALSGVLRDESYTVEAVSSGEACLERVTRGPVVDLIVGPQSYHRLPEMIARSRRIGRPARHLRTKKIRQPVAVINRVRPNLIENRFLFHRAGRRRWRRRSRRDDRHWRWSSLRQPGRFLT